MSNATHSQFKFIEARHLSLSPLNVRKTGGANGIEQLAELIAAEGVVQNLDVYEDVSGEGKKRTTHAVVGGGRRWRALQLLIKQKRIKPEFPVPCLVVSRDRAIQVSLTENSGREEMHAADQFEAFKQLVDAGQPVEDVAARFGVEPVVVRRRLKLANVCPKFLDLYRKEKLTLEHLMALAATDDQERQQQIWDSLKPYDRNPSTIRRLLTEHEVAAGQPLAKFVGLKAYEKAGGAVRRDLFQEDDDGVMLDSELVRRLAVERLERQAEKLKTEGVAWVEVRPEWSYQDRADYGHARTNLRDATEAEQAEIDALEARRAALEEECEAVGNNEQRQAEVWQQLEPVESRLREIDAQRQVVDPEQQACAGAVVSIGRDGKLAVERDLLRPEDAKRFMRTNRTTPAAPKAARVHSAALVRRLTAQRTLALQAVLAQRTDVAILALTHRLVLRTFPLYGGERHSVVQVDAKRPAFSAHADELAGSKAQVAIQARREELETSLPAEPAQLFAWLLDQPQDVVLGLLAFCVAQSVDGITEDETRGPTDELVRAAGLDMREWWTATAASYFWSVSGTRVLEVVTEAVSAETAAPLAKMKKAALVQAAEEKVGGTGWLPALLRNAD
jgi:ParB family transcriptional regulator, chromosome partitioning protein